MLRLGALLAMLAGLACERTPMLETTATSGSRRAKSTEGVLPDRRAGVCEVGAPEKAGLRGGSASPRTDCGFAGDYGSHH